MTTSPTNAKDIAEYSREVPHLTQPNIDAMADAYKESALCAADMEGCRGLDQFSRAGERLRKWHREEKIAALSAEYGPQTMGGQVRLNALRRAHDILDEEELRYTTRTLVALAEARVKVPKKGAG